MFDLIDVGYDVRRLPPCGHLIALATTWHQSINASGRPLAHLFETNRSDMFDD